MRLFVTPAYAFFPFATAALLLTAGCGQNGQAVQGDGTGSAAGTASVTFAVAYRERIALGDNAIVEAQLLAFEPGSDRPELVSEAREPFNGRQVPIDLTLTYDPEAVATDRELAVSGRILDPDSAQVWITPEDARFPAGNPAADLGVIMLVRSNHAASDDTAYMCDDGQSFSARYHAPDITLTMGDAAYILASVPAASGARFEAGSDEGPRAFWSRGEGALVRFETDGEWVQCQSSAYLPEESESDADQPEPEPAVYTARGNEPGWILRLAGGEAEYLGDYGETRLSGRVTGRAALDEETNVLTVSGDDGELFTIQITHTICQDSMAGLSYPDTVTITLGDVETYSGCGGDAESLLAGEVWRVTHVAGEEVPGPRAVTMEFDGQGRLSGQAPCNRYSASYQMTGEGIVLGQGVSTRMACAGDLMALETTFLGIIQGSLPASIDTDGVLSLGEGRIIAVRE
ncbi:META domain-containing protein [Glycocaulis alkaliphilus]|uniref:META domain-containing protein n=1 Tax=Glycocaulis alkaliphilus TaxID=1434191 RepID=UPI0014769C64|nr:META domain-containing protein [Glycocaulis alkaliphilus]